MRHELVTAGEADGSRFRDILARGEESVDAGEQALALRAARGIAEPLGREDRGSRERRGIPECEVREAGQSRLESVDDVEATSREGEREARADADRDAHAAATGDRHRRAERDQLRFVEGAEERSPARSEIAGAVRGREDGDGVAAAPQLAREHVHVLVHVVRLRPGERRNERDPHVGRV